MALKVLDVDEVTGEIRYVLDEKWGATRYCPTKHTHSFACAQSMAAAKAVLEPAMLDEQGAIVKAAVLGPTVSEEVGANASAAQAAPSSRKASLSQAQAAPSSRKASLSQAQKDTNL